MSEDLDALEELRERIIGCAITVHSALGPGMLESSCRKCLAIELRKGMLAFEQEWFVDLVYGGEVVQKAYRVDLVVERSIVVEIKAVERLLPVHTAQVITYLKLAGCPYGLILTSTSLS
jgi:GxxExxY protein